MDQFGIRPLRPTLWSRIEFIREHANGGRDHYAFDGEERCAFVFPVESSPGDRRIRQPGERDVIENIVAGQAFVPPAKTRAIIS